MPTDPVSIETRLIEYEADHSGEGYVLVEDYINDAVWQAIDIEPRKLDDLFGEFVFRIPEYQRGFSWEEKHFEDLWFEIEPLFTDKLEPKMISDVFFGSAFFAEIARDPGSRIELEVIDGQQRLTTVSLILRILHEEMEEIPLGELPDELRETLKDNTPTVKRAIFENVGSKAKRAALTLNGHNDEFYRALIGDSDTRIEFIRSKERVHGNRKTNAIRAREYAELLDIDPTSVPDENKAFEESNLRLLRAYHYFNRRLSERLPSDPVRRSRALINVWRYLMQNFVIGYFKVDQEFPALLMDIFQVLNDRGMDLNKIDIIRARIVSKFRQEKVDESEIDEYLGRWEEIIDRFEVDYDSVSDCLIDYLTVVESDVTARSVVAENLLAAFMLEEPIRKQEIPSRLLTLDQTKQFLEEFEEYAAYYHDIIYPYDEGLTLDDAGIESRCDDILRRLTSLRTKQWRPLVLAVYAKVRRSPTPEAERYLLETLEQVELVTFRQVLASVNPNQLEVIYAKTAHRFEEEGFDYDIAPDLYGEFKARYPNAVGDSFARVLNEESDFSNRNGRALLWKLASEHDMEHGFVKKQFEMGKTHLEHILPKKPLLDVDGDGRYLWVRAFFDIDPDWKIEEVDPSDPTLEDVIGTLIELEADDTLVQILTEHFVNDIANMLILLGDDNIAGGNQPFSVKLPIYHTSAGFDELTTNEFFLEGELGPGGIEPLIRYRRSQQALSLLGDEDPEAIARVTGIEVGTMADPEEELENRIEAIETDDAFEEARSRTEQLWDIETFIERKKRIMEQLLTSLRFDDEVFPTYATGDAPGSDLDEQVEDQLRIRQDIILAEQKAIVDELR